MRLLLTTALLLFAEAAALACSCVPPQTDEEKRERARRIAIGAEVIAEVDLAEPMDWKRGTGELLRPVKIHLGEPRESWRVERSFTQTPDGQVVQLRTSCDVYFEPGRTIAILYRPAYRWQEGDKLAKEWAQGGGCARAEVRASAAALHRGPPPALWRAGGGCDAYFVSDPEGLGLVLDEARKLGRLPSGD